MNSIKRIVVLCLVVLLSFPTQCKAAVTANVSNEFLDILYTNNISVKGTNANMTESQIEGFINMFDNNKITQKYVNKITDKKNDIEIAPTEILEMHYYSLNPDERKTFLLKIENQTVDVIMKNGVILISYNVNNLTNGDLKLMSTTSSYTSTRTATIIMQEAVTGTWGHVDATLTGYFIKVTSANSWTLSTNGYNLSTDDYSPCHTFTTQVGGPESVTSSSTYLGWEVSYDAQIQVSCGFQYSNLYIIVYPNSSYNTAWIG